LAQVNKFEISPHPDAPQLSDPKEAPVYLSQLIKEASSENFQGTEEVRDLMRQASLVNLWFFLKFVAGFAGPFDKLNTNLHREMCNFAQLTMKPGKKAGAFVPRFHYKSTIFTIGAPAWLPLRDPDTRLKINASKVDRACDFVQTTQRIYDSNELFGWLFEDYVPEKSQYGWNAFEMTVPNRRKHYKEPTLRAGSVGEASEGDHFTGIIHDDIIGKKVLDVMGQSNIEMAKITKGFKTDNSTLIIDAVSSFVFVVGTRYGLDDTYEEVMKSLKRLFGYRKVLALGGYKERDSGEWAVYYRCVKEEDGDGKQRIIFPEAITEDYLSKMLEDDPWTYWTQMVNLPQQAGMAEFLNLKVHDCEVVKEEENYFVEIEFPRERIPIEKLEVTGGFDPAFTESGLTAKTSRSAIAIWGQDALRRKFLLDLRVGYVSPLTALDWIFELVEKYKGSIKVFYFEKAASQKFLRELAENQRLERGIFVTFGDVSAIGDKDARIRSVLGPDLEAGRVYVNRVPGVGTEFKQEVKSFPQAHLKDVLDASVIALAKNMAPLSEEEEEGIEEQEEAFRSRITNAFGW
jgi:predicted phage terminase large subunit-like protein